MSTRKPPFTPIGVLASHDTITLLRELLGDAESGELIGACVAVMYRRRKYAVGFSGECARNRPFARGIVDDLHDELGIDNE